MSFSSSAGDVLPSAMASAVNVATVWQARYDPFVRLVEPRVRTPTPPPPTPPPTPPPPLEFADVVCQTTNLQYDEHGLSAINLTPGDRIVAAHPSRFVPALNPTPPATAVGVAAGTTMGTVAGYYPAAPQQQQQQQPPLNQSMGLLRLNSPASAPPSVVPAFWNTAPVQPTAIMASPTATHHQLAPLSIATTERPATTASLPTHQRPLSADGHRPTAQRLRMAAAATPPVSGPSPRLAMHFGAASADTNAVGLESSFNSSGYGESVRGPETPAPTSPAELGLETNCGGDTGGGSVGLLCNAASVQTIPEFNFFPAGQAQLPRRKPLRHWSAVR
eukprot:m.118337 g.118337  ORF g.118337 m.118337 type:complete len:333 (+) comp16426_c2_seq1:98-1096(+)